MPAGYDIAGSASASWADAFSSQLGFNFGSKTYNFGSGAQTVTTKTDTGQGMDTAADARAVASTAKAGDGGVAESSASMIGDNIPQTIGGFDIKTIAIAALVIVLGVFAMKKGTT
jgi:hypothetical protein